MSELKTCPFCGGHGTGPLWHSKGCYITLLYDVLEFGYANIKEPPEDELVDRWNARTTNDLVNEDKDYIRDLEIRLHRLSGILHGDTMYPYSDIEEMRELCNTEKELREIT